MYMSSPVFGDGLIYGHSSKKKGQFVAIDAKTGAVRWATEGREGEHASLLLTPQHVVFLTNSADLIVAKRGAPAFAVERRYEVAEGGHLGHAGSAGIKYTGARRDRINAAHGW